MALSKRWPVQLTWSIVEERGRTLVAEDDGAAVLKHGPFSRTEDAVAFVKAKRAEVEQAAVQFNERQRRRARLTRRR